tara:strand:- start:365 stop:898 length:534 start_codon:yes stop_codon:yes gene_type:complete
MIEDTNSNATLNTNMTKVKGMEDGMSIHGYVTVVKNAGTDNEEIICKDKPNLLTNSGRDWMHTQVYTYAAAATTNGAYFIGLSSDTATPAVGNTLLASEITTGGLERASGSTTHGAGTNSTQIQKTFTSSATHTAVVKAALFNQLAVGGTMAHINTFTSVTLQPSDTLQVTWTVTLG